MKKTKMTMTKKVAMAAHFGKPWATKAAAAKVHGTGRLGWI